MDTHISGKVGVHDLSGKVGVHDLPMDTHQVKWLSTIFHQESGCPRSSIRKVGVHDLHDLPISALTHDLQKLMIFASGQQEWREIAQGKSLIVESSRRGNWLYYQDLLAPFQPVYRVPPAGGKIERVIDYAHFLGEGSRRCALAGVAPDDSLMFIIDRGSSNLCALELESR